MTSDMIQNTYTSREKRQQFAKPEGSAKGYFGDSDRAFNNNENKSSVNKGNVAPLSHPESNTTSLLKMAYKMLQQAERNLAHKEERIKNLENILTIDELTSLTNRRGFYKAFEGELDRTNRGENPGGLLIMIDLDFFKDINDTYGHLAGDEALRTVGRFLRSAMRPMDVVARLGGDEFIILMPGANISKAMKRARKIGNDLDDLTFDWNGHLVKISASIGLKEYIRGDTIESIIEQADRGLYMEKDDRKNKLASSR